LSGELFTEDVSSRPLRICNNYTDFTSYINNIQQDATGAGIITANSLYMFRASIDPIIRSTSNYNTASGTGNTVSTEVLN